MAVGSVLSVVHQQPMARYTLASTASFLMLAGCFSGAPSVVAALRTLLACVGAHCSAGCMQDFSVLLHVPHQRDARPPAPPYLHAAVQEVSRLVRCRDSPTNSVIGGAATGALLYKTHGEGLQGRV